MILPRKTLPCLALACALALPMSIAPFAWAVEDDEEIAVDEADEEMTDDETAVEDEEMADDETAVEDEEMADEETALEDEEMADEETALEDEEMADDEAAVDDEEMIDDADLPEDAADDEEAFDEDEEMTDDAVEDDEEMTAEDDVADDVDAGDEVAADAPAADAPLNTRVDNLWHYALIARYDLAATEANAILQAGKPAEILTAFQTVSAQRNNQPFDPILLRLQNVEQTREVTNKIVAAINEAYRAQAGNQNYIEQQIFRLSVNERAYQLALAQLRESGELAVPLMIRVLQNPQHAEHHSAVRRALRDLGRTVLNPLLAATQMNDQDTLVTIIGVLGGIGFDAAAPQLLRIANDDNASASVRNAAIRSLARLGVSPDASVGDAMFALAEKFYYGNASIVADPRQPNAYVWDWVEGTGLRQRNVPHPVFNEIMAMRYARNAMAADPPSQGDAVSLWLAANNKREAELPAGATDPTAPPYPAHFYNVTTGTQYLTSVLARSLKDRNTAVALKAIQSMQEVVGRDNLFAGNASATLASALRSGDRLVRFEAAMALAAGLPTQRFDGSARVVPLLGEALSQTGVGNVLIVAGNADEQTKLAGDLPNYGTAGGVGATEALAAARSLPSVDVILISRGTSDAEVARVIAGAADNHRLANASKIIMRTSRAGRWGRAAINDRSLSVTTANDASGLTKVIDAARSSTGAINLNEQVAQEYALRAADLMAKLAISPSGQVLDVTVAEPTLLVTLNDKREPVAVAAARVLALLNLPSVQPAVLTRATDDRAPEPVKIGMFNALAQHAKFFGSQLDAGGVDTLRTAVANATSPEVREAAAEALGALNLPSEQAKLQILNIGKEKPEGTP